MAASGRGLRTVFPQLTVPSAMLLQMVVLAMRPKMGKVFLEAGHDERWSYAAGDGS